jgi:hypothetical protein
MTGSALVVGSSGVVGSNLVRQLSRRLWQVSGLARRPQSTFRGVVPIAADVLDASSISTALDGANPTHVFIATWRPPLKSVTMRRPPSRKCRSYLPSSGAPYEIKTSKQHPRPLDQVAIGAIRFYPRSWQTYEHAEMEASIGVNERDGRTLHDTQLLFDADTILIQRGSEDSPTCHDD